MKYGIIFWGNSSDSKKVFTLQKKKEKKIGHENSYGFASFSGWIAITPFSTHFWARHDLPKYWR
jgi:hypothetical protein